MATRQARSGDSRTSRLIAQGGMGCVYLGEQLPLGRPVAVKVLIPQSYDDEFRRRFLLEASINAKLSHRHIVTVHDYGETEEGHLFMAMEYLDGEPLSRAINREVRQIGSVV
ncbi:MAG: protein kinase [Myxococcota bacterium]